MRVGRAGRAVAISVALLLLAMVAAGGVILLRWRPEPAPNRVTQDVPAAARSPRRAAPAVKPSGSTAERGAVHRSRVTGVAGAEAVALGGELRRNRQAVRDIDAALRESDAAADQLRAQVARQDDVIAAQRQTLGAGPAAQEAADDAEAGLAAAVQTNDGARTSLARYEATRSALLGRKTSLIRRDAVIADRLRR